MNITPIDALNSLMPNTEWVWRYDNTPEYSGLEWAETTQIKPTESEIQTEMLRLQTEYDALEYARLREADYPSLQDCLHAILDDDLEALQVKRQEVKNRYPKP